MHEQYRFIFMGSFNDKDAAELCVTAAEPIGLTSRTLAPVGIQDKWSVRWTFISKPDRVLIRAVEAKIHAAISNCGGQLVDVVISKCDAALPD